MSELARTVEALLFLSPDPVDEARLAEACAVEREEIEAALRELQERYAPGKRGIELRELAGGWTFATAPDTEDAARRLLAKPRTPPLTAAQAETLAIVAYLQPVSRPEIARIRGVSADSAVGTLLERGLIEESGRSEFGAILYRTTPLFLKLFGLKSLDELPDVSQWDPSPEEQAELRDRLLRAGEARAGGGQDDSVLRTREDDDQPEGASQNGAAPGEASADGHAEGEARAEAEADPSGGEQEPPAVEGDAEGGAEAVVEAAPVPEGSAGDTAAEAQAVPASAGEAETESAPAGPAPVEAAPGPAA
jgi:segregation and condensation protein B